MGSLTVRERLRLGKELGEAKIRCLINNGYSVSEVARVMKLNESTVRSIMKKKQHKESK